jgi:hypothetical protein
MSTAALFFLLLASPVVVPEDPLTDPSLARLVPADAVVLVEAAAPARLHEALVGHAFGPALLGPDGLFASLADGLDLLPEGVDTGASAALFLAVEPSAEERAAADPRLAALHAFVRASSGALQVHVAGDPFQDELRVALCLRIPGSAREHVERLAGAFDVPAAFAARRGFDVLVDPRDQAMPLGSGIVACRDDLLVVTGGTSLSEARREFVRIADLVTGAGGGSDAAAAAPAALAKARGALSTAGHVRVLVDTSFVGAAVRAAVDGNSGLSEANRAGLAALELEAMRFAALQGRFGAGESFDVEALLAFPGAGLLHELVGLMDARANPALLARVPSDATSVEVVNFDLAACAARLGTWLLQYAPDLVMTYETEMGPIVERTGVDVLGVLVDEFSGQALSFATPPRPDGAGASDVAALAQSLGRSSAWLLEARDTARLERCFEALLDFGEETFGAPLPVDEIVVDGRRVRGIEAGSSTWIAFGERVVVVGADPDLVGRLAGAAPGETPRLPARLALVLESHAGDLAAGATDLGASARALASVAAGDSRTGLGMAGLDAVVLSAVARAARGLDLDAVMWSGLELRDGCLRFRMSVE